MTKSPSILAFSGSARRASLNKKYLAVAVQEVRNAGGEVTLVDLTDFEMPIYNGDIEDVAGVPLSAGRLVKLIKEHQGLLIASPEYNSMITPLLKNTLDWCTRADDDPFPGKVAAVISASPGGYGGNRSLKQAQQLLTHLGCQVVPAQASLSQANKAFTEDDKLTDARALQAVQHLARALVETAAKLA